MKLSTFLVIIGLIIISLYFLVEVSYYASAETVLENKSDVPRLLIPKINVDQNINNKSISYGIYHEPKSAKPGFGTTILFGHRTFYGSPFLNLDKLKKGDKITVAWPEIGNVEYTVEKSFIVPASYRMSVEQGKTLFLITCYPLGSSKERLIIQANQTKIYPFQIIKKEDMSKKPYAFAFIGLFLAIGLILDYAYPVKEDKIILFITTIALTLFLLFGYFFPIPAEQLTSYLSNLSSFFGG
ncbi:MAG: class E sortase [Methanobacterium sp.]|nr:class E sortase [Methanobacterium sp.]